MERRKLWWNGQWGRQYRRDLLVYEDGGQWWVEIHRGEAAGTSRWCECPDEDAALDLVRDLMAGSDGWRELPTI